MRRSDDRNDGWAALRAEVRGTDRSVIMMEGTAGLAAPQPTAPASSPFGGRPNKLSPEKLKVDRAARPDWPTGAEQAPVAGGEVYCTAGVCTVTRVLGRTGNGSRLLELRLAGEDRRSFFAAASNVLVRPDGT